MKTKVSIIVALIATLALGGCNFFQQKENQKSSNKKEVIKIGADFSLTGGLSYWSTELKKGLDLAISEKDTNHLRKVEILYNDNGFKASRAVSIFKKFSAIDNVSVVLSCFTPIGEALRPLAKKLKIPLVATVTSAKDFSLENNWVFRDFPTQSQQGEIIAKYAYNVLNLRKGSFLVVNDDYGRDGAEIFKKTFDSLGGDCYQGEYFSQSDIDIRNQITKLMYKKPQFLFVVGRDKSLAAASRQIREINNKITILGVNAFDASVVWKYLGNAGEGIIFTSAQIDYNKPDALKFEKLYYNRYNEEPNYVSVYGYTIGRYLIDILLKTGNNPLKIKKALTNLDITSIRGKLQMNKDRDVISPIGIYKRTNNKTILISN